MRLNDSIVTIALAYYLNGKDEAKLRRCARLMLPRSGPRAQKTIRLLLAAKRPGAVMELTLTKLEALAEEEVMAEAQCYPAGATAPKQQNAIAA